MAHLSAVQQSGLFLRIIFINSADCVVAVMCYSNIFATILWRISYKSA